MIIFTKSLHDYYSDNVFKIFEMIFISIFNINEISKNNFTSFQSLNFTQQFLNKNINEFIYENNDFPLYIYSFDKNVNTQIHKQYLSFRKILITYNTLGFNSSIFMQFLDHNNQTVGKCIFFNGSSFRNLKKTYYLFESDENNNKQNLDIIYKDSNINSYFDNMENNMDNFSKSIEELFNYYKVNERTYVTNINIYDDMIKNKNTLMETILMYYKKNKLFSIDFKLKINSFILSVLSLNDIMKKIHSTFNINNKEVINIFRDIFHELKKLNVSEEFLHRPFFEIYTSINQFINISNTHVMDIWNVKLNNNSHLANQIEKIKEEIFGDQYITLNTILRIDNIWKNMIRLYKMGMNSII